MAKEKIKMNNVLDYLEWRGDLTFKQDPINKIDLLIFSTISLLDLDNLIEDDDTIETISKKFFKGKKAKDLELGLIIPKSVFLLFKNMSTVNRYKDLKITNYINDISIEDNEQISALTFLIENDAVIVFSGTDDTIIGWKENFMMIYDKEVPAEAKSIEYLNNIHNAYPDKGLYIAGHSKGGHLAVYSSLNVSSTVQEKIKKVYNFDGPGQNDDAVKKILENNMQDKITTIIPQASTVGRLFNHLEEMKIIYSHQTGLYQHDPFSWQVVGNDFLYTDKVDTDSVNLNNKINEVLLGMTCEERKQMVETLYELLSVNGSRSLTSTYSKKNLLFTSYLKLSKDKRNAIYKPFSKLLKDKSAQKVVFDSIRIYVMESKRTHEFDKELEKKLTDN